MLSGCWVFVLIICYLGLLMLMLIGVGGFAGWLVCGVGVLVSFVVRLDFCCVMRLVGLLI